MTPHERLRRLRLACKVTQTEMGRRLNHDQAWVSRIERGAFEVTAIDYVAWCAALGHHVSLEPQPDADLLGQLHSAISGLDESQLKTLIQLARLISVIPRRVLDGLVLFARSQAPADEDVG